MIKIRKFRLGDAVSLARLHRGTIRSINKKDYSPKKIEVWSRRTSAKRFRDLGKINERYVALNDNKIVGFGDYKDNEVMGLYVHKNFIGNRYWYSIVKKD